MLQADQPEPASRSPPEEDTGRQRGPIDVLDEAVYCSITVDQIIVTLATHAVLRPSEQAHESLALAVKARDTLDQLADTLDPHPERWGRLSAHVYALEGAMSAIDRAVRSAAADATAGPGTRSLRERLDLGLRAQSAMTDFFDALRRNPEDGTQDADVGRQDS